MIESNLIVDTSSLDDQGTDSFDGEHVCRASRLTMNETVVAANCAVSVLNGFSSLQGHHHSISEEAHVNSQKPRIDGYQG